LCIFLFGHGLQMPLFVVSLKIRFCDMSSFQMPKTSLDIPHTTNKFGPLIPCRLRDRTLEAVPLATSRGTSAQIMACVGWGEQGKVGHALRNPGLCKSICCCITLSIFTKLKCFSFLLSSSYYSTISLFLSLTTSSEILKCTSDGHFTIP